MADSTVLAYVLSELNQRHDYGLDLFLLSVDEGITGYRDDSLETVKRNEIQVWCMTKPCLHNILILNVWSWNLKQSCPFKMIHYLFCISSSPSSCLLICGFIYTFSMDFLLK